MGSSVPPVSCRVLAAAAQPEATVLGPSDDGIGLPPLSRLCFRLWKLERLPSPPGQGRVNYPEGSAHSPAVCCFANCKVFITESGHESLSPFPEMTRPVTEHGKNLGRRVSMTRSLTKGPHGRVCPLFSGLAAMRTIWEVLIRTQAQLGQTPE